MSRYEEPKEGGRHDVHLSSSPRAIQLRFFLALQKREKTNKFEPFTSSFAVVPAPPPLDAGGSHAGNENENEEEEESNNPAQSSRLQSLLRKLALLPWNRSAGHDGGAIESGEAAAAAAADAGAGAGAGAGTPRRDANAH